jgi:hypothetical protein
MIEAGLRFHWSTQVRTDVARDPELVRLMKRAGCHTVFIGFEADPVVRLGPLRYPPSGLPAVGVHSV